MVESTHTKQIWARALGKFAAALCLVAAGAADATEFTWLQKTQAGPVEELNASNALLSFDPPVVVIACNQTTSVAVRIDAAIVDLRGFSLVFEYNPAVVRPVSVQLGSSLESAGCASFFSWLNPTALDGSIELDVSMLGCSIDGPGTLAVLKFAGIVDGSSYLRRAAGGILRDSNNVNIPFQCSEATIDHLCPVNDQQSSWSALKASFP